MNLSLLNPLYWLSIQPANVDGIIGKILISVLLFLIVFGVVCRIISRRRVKDHYEKKIGKRLGTLGITMGILGIILVFFSYENITFFGARLWYPVWVTGLIYWVIVIICYLVRDLPFFRSRDISQSAKNKYMPKKKKR